MSRQWIGLGLLFAASCMFLNSDCEKDPDEATASFAQFSYEILGNKLSVTNKSLFSDTYEWDFGNGVTSIDERPTPGPESYIHYEEFGKYLN